MSKEIANDVLKHNGWLFIVIRTRTKNTNEE